MDQILQASQNQGTIMLVSDASVQKTKQSGFAWVISHNDVTLWKGAGLAPGLAEDIYSGRAKASGLIAGLTFLKHYVSSYEHTCFKATLLCCYCNNLGVITNISALLKPLIMRPNDTTNDNWDVYMAIQTLALDCYPLQLWFFHVKGHQDKDPSSCSHVLSS